MEAEIRTISNKFLVGMYKEMSPADNTTPELWQNFMPRRTEIQHLIPNIYFAIQEYSEVLDFKDFQANNNFKMWAAVEVSKLTDLPRAMACLTLPAGKYAVFIHKGPVRTFHKTSQYIYGQWIPGSDYILDHRPHFEIMTEEYLGPDHPESEEEVWIPIKPKL